jgi:murein L,D-transpeptidase YafK
MHFRWAHAAFLLLGLSVAGCNNTSIEDLAPKAEKQLPDKLLHVMQAKGMSVSSPIMVRIFKEEGQFEIWKAKANGRYDLVTSYPICKWSGELGPKYMEGDRQAPEGFYMIRPSQMNPKSNYYLSFNIGFPNAYDRAHGRTGANLMVHGACSSSGCYSMSDAEVAQIYAFAREAFRGGQQAFQIQAFPFRMTAENMARYRDDPNFEFWKMLKEGYDHFEITRQPPKVDVCNGRYVFDETPAAGHDFSATGACPPMSQPPALVAAYQAYQKKYDADFAAAVKRKGAAPKPTIDGIKEASLVADWSRRRARGERVPIEPPSLNADGSITETTRMGRIDSPLGRKMAALDAEKAAKKKAAEEKAAQLAAAKAAKEAEKARARAARESAVASASQQAKGKDARLAGDTPGATGADPQAGQDPAALPAENAMAPADGQSVSLGRRIWKKMFGS